jgi:hypothetical protein
MSGVIIKIQVSSNLGSGWTALFATSNGASLKFYCGFWTPGDAGSSLPYMPSACNNSNLSAL